MSDSLLLDRFQKTHKFMLKHLDPNAKLLDLGTENDLSRYLRSKGFDVQNTQGENLDTDYKGYLDCEVDAVCSFEIFEHMLAPFNFLSQLKTNKLIASVPLKLWFASAYWNEKDDWDKHYHEFEPKQFDYLLEKSGWKILDSEKWTSSSWKRLGIRPFLRHFTPRYYIVYCERLNK